MALTRIRVISFFGAVATFPLCLIDLEFLQKLVYKAMVAYHSFDCSKLIPIATLTASNDTSPILVTPSIITALPLHIDSTESPHHNTLPHISLK